MAQYQNATGVTSVKTLLFLSVVGLSFGLVILLAQDFRITDLSIGANGKVSLRHTADTNFYYILYRGAAITMEGKSWRKDLVRQARRKE